MPETAFTETVRMQHSGHAVCGKMCSDRSQLNCKKQDGFQTHFGLFKDGFSHLMKASDHYIQKIFVFYD
jgi:hypothetical protein